MKHIVLLCHSVLEDENRVQFNRTKFLCTAFATHILSVGDVSKKACEGAQKVNSFPLRIKGLQWLYILWCLWKIKQIQKARKLDLIWSTYQPRMIISGFLARGLAHCKWVADVWDDPAKSLLLTKKFGGSSKLGSLLVKKIELGLASCCLPKADMVVTTMGENLVHRFRIPPENVVHVTNGIALNLEYPTEDCPKSQLTPTLFYCGTVDEVRLEGLSQAFTEMLKEIPSIRLVVVGYQLNDGYKWLQRTLEPFRGRIALENMGVQPFREVVRLIGEADVCICPYPAKLDLEHAIPVKLLEYMACGRAIVASDLPGIRRVLEDGVTALLFRSGDYREMGQKLALLLKSAELRLKLGKNARDVAQSYAWEKIHREIYSRVSVV